MLYFVYCESPLQKFIYNITQYWIACWVISGLTSHLLMWECAPRCVHWREWILSHRNMDISKNIFTYHFFSFLEISIWLISWTCSGGRVLCLLFLFSIIWRLGINRGCRALCQTDKINNSQEISAVENTGVGRGCVTVVVVSRISHLYLLTLHERKFQRAKCKFRGERHLTSFSDHRICCF